MKTHRSVHGMAHRIRYLDALEPAVADMMTFSRERQAPGPTRRKGSRKVFRPAALGPRQEKPERVSKRDGRAQARSGKEIIAWEFRTPSGWYAHPTPLLTVIDPDRVVALQYVYALGRTTGDIDCGLIDLVPIRRRDL